MGSIDGGAIACAAMSELLPAIVQEPDRPAEAAVIWLHGLGASGDDFAPIPPELGLPPSLAVRFVFPHAPRRPVTINMGMVMPAWYDIKQLDARGGDEAGIRESAKHVRALIDREQERGVPASKIVLAGFSQGGAVAVHTGLRAEERLAGIMVLSAYLPLADTLPAELTPAGAETPVLMAHGTHDPMVPIVLAEQSRAVLEGHGIDVAWHSYPMAHQVCHEQIITIGQWLTRVLE